MMVFHRRWKAKLGVAAMPEVQKEHWTRVKALNRRFAEATDDQYDRLRPASDLREALKDEIYKTIEIPLRWEGERPSDDVVLTAVIDAFSNAIATRLPMRLIRERLSVRPLKAWQESYALSGSGSRSSGLAGFLGRHPRPERARARFDSLTGSQRLPALDHRLGGGGGSRGGVSTRMTEGRVVEHSMS